MKPRYRDGLVAFVDILGWKSLVKSSVDDLMILECIVNLSSSQTAMGNIASQGNKIQHFRMSDASVFIADPLDDIQVLTLVSSIINIHTTLLLNGILVRGSIVLGKIYFSKEENTVLGPALVDAYLNSEEGLANYPRTILDDASTELISRICKKEEYSAELLKIYPGTNGIPLFRDFDDLFCASYLGGFMQQSFTEHYRAIIQEALSSCKGDRKVFQKYSWIKNYFNSVYPDSKI